MKKDLKKALHEPYIIRSRGTVSPLIRMRDLLMTVALWFVYIYLLRDFFIFLSDIYHWLHDDMGPASAYPKLRIFETLQDYGYGLAVMATLFVGWAVYNRLRFRNKKRRKASEPVAVEEAARSFHVEAADLKKWQKERCLVVHHDKKGRISDVEPLK